MSQQIFINLAVSDVEKSQSLYTAMGFQENPMFSDGDNKCMAWNDAIYVMILNHPKFKSFIQKPISDTKNTVAALYSLSFSSLEDMNAAAENAVKSGAIEVKELTDYGFMIQRTIEDFDGYIWELFYMDMSKIPQ